ncbi:hydrogenase accessory protein HypB [Calothrix sp. NIES-2100]|uniref:hypothetical protein n=1 Tax=Calothrix sp. NIES-2100 TaxID=1954172 RepID=UPI000B5F1EB0|nr:hydrogenase accessory protein HypB [Calothrix sp. NIES-2100]
MVAGGIHRWEHEYNPSDLDLVLVENVVNLVCPAKFEVVEHAKVALLSITEGEDKPFSCLLINFLSVLTVLVRIFDYWYIFND